MPEASSPISGSKSGDPSGSSSMSSTTLTIGKVFGHCDKLNKDNYEVWLAGLLSAIAGLTIVSEFYVQLEKTIDYLKGNAHLAIETVSEYIGEHILVLPRGGRDRLHGT